MRATTWELLRKRPWAGIAGSLLLHLLLIGGILWVGPPRMAEVKRGEPLFVELPKADEEAMRGMPAAEPAKAAPPAPPAPRPAPPAAPAARTPPAPRAEPKPAPPAAVAKAAPAPTPPAPKEESAAEATPAKAPPPAAAPTPPEAQPREATPPAPRVAAGTGPREPAPDLRSALRRGGQGQGGAGGRGEGRAGIEGEPIPLDSKDPQYSDYLDRIRRMIKDKWSYPCVKDSGSARCEYKSAQLIIEFGILKDGRVPFVIVRERSAYEVYDEYAERAILLASPFPPVPESMAKGKPGIPILATFSYMVESSLTNLLR
jgi:outer membrane biosynthesis protein TonB